jgi:hypothetical protein
MCELVKFLKSEGLDVRDGDAPDTFWLGFTLFVVSRGEVTCLRGCSLNLAAPDSLQRLVSALKHCAKSGSCTSCPLGKVPRTISINLYQHIGDNCKTNCEDLCGRFGFHYCPLK